MKEHPNRFGGDMVRAILDDRKTMRLQVVKPQPPFAGDSNDLGVRVTR